MRYTAATPFQHFLTSSTTIPVLETINARYEAVASKCPPSIRPIERLHIIDNNVETACFWLILLGQLAARPGCPQGPANYHY